MIVACRSKAGQQYWTNAIDIIVAAAIRIAHETTSPVKQSLKTATQADQRAAAPSQVEIIIAPEATPAEKMYDEFKKTFGQIGGMKTFNGSSLNDQSTVAWDEFTYNNKIKVVREITDLDNDKGRITFKMAYQNDAPWVVQKEESPAGSNHPFATTKVGWDENGQLVLKQKVANGQNSEVSTDEAKAMFAHAQQAYTTASAKLPKK